MFPHVGKGAEVQFMESFRKPFAERFLDLVFLKPKSAAVDGGAEKQDVDSFGGTNFPACLLGIYHK